MKRIPPHWFKVVTFIAFIPCAINVALAQTLNENCTVSVLNRTVRVNPDGSWVLPNIPANFGQVKARATCVQNGVTTSGESDFFTIPANGAVNLPAIILGNVTQVPVSLGITPGTPSLTALGQTLQLVVTATYPDISTKDVSAANTGTNYTTSNPAIVSVGANGLLTAVANGTVVIQATNDGATGIITAKVTVAGVDSDSDGIPDDAEVRLGLDPHNAVDAQEDFDRDNLTNLQEFQLGTDIRKADTDGDGLSDEREVNAHNTNPLLADTDADLIPDGVEIQTGTNPLDRNSYDLKKAAASSIVKPSSFALTTSILFPIASQQLTWTVTLIDGKTTLDLTDDARTSYSSSNLTVCNFGAKKGEVFAGNAGNCIITITNNTLSATASGNVKSFTPSALSFVTIPGYANNVDINGNHAYVAAGAAGLQVVDVSDRKLPHIVGSLDTPGNANDVRVVGNRAYIADGAAGLQIIDVTNPTSPSLLGAVDTPGEAQDVVVVGTRAYVADGATGLQIINVSNPSAPAILGSVDTPGTAKGVDVSGDFAAVADGSPSSAVRIIDITDPTNPAIVGNVSIPGEAKDLVVRSTNAYVAAFTGGFRIVDFSTPASPRIAGGLPGNTPGFVPRDVELSGEFAFAAEQLFPNVVPIVDITNNANPVFRTTINFAPLGDYAGTGIAVDSQFVYMTGEFFIVGPENGTTGNTRLFIGQYRDVQDNLGVPPTVQITSPPAGTQVIHGTPVTVTLSAADDVAVASVSLLVNGQVISTTNTAPYTFTFNAPSFGSTFTIAATASDFGNNVGQSPTVTLNLIPDPLTTVIGRVVDSNGTPVSGATVSVFSKSTTTQADGTFSIVGVPTVSGDIIVTASAIINGKTQRGRSQPVAPVPSGTTDVNDVRLTSLKIALIHCDDTAGFTAARSALLNTQLFTAEDVTTINACSAPPSLATLSEFGAVLVWSNFSFSQPDALGNVLADFVDQGGGVVLATYVYSQPWRIGGRMNTTGYSPFTVSSALLTTSGQLNLANSNTNHPLLAGVLSTDTYFTNSNYTNPSLTTGSTLIAVDTAGNRVVAANPNNRVVGVVIYPGLGHMGRLFANALNFVR